jgi:hypothetical protein
MLKDYRELKVWQKSYRLCLDLYRITKNFPKEKRCTLTSQIRRVAVSIPSNIALEPSSPTKIGEEPNNLKELDREL